MTSLHISHTVRDFDSWLTTFNSFGDFRTEGGVTGLTVRRGVDDPGFVAVDLDFDSLDQARAFLEQLETKIWPTSPHIDGTPTVRVLDSIGVAVA